METGGPATNDASLSRGFFLTASLARAFTEAASLTLILALPFVTGGGPWAADLTVGLVMGPLCAMLFAARTRLGADGRRERLVREGPAALIVAAFPAAVGAFLALRSGVPDPVSLDAAVLFLWNLGALVFFRSLAHLWPRWVVLRRGRLRWEMTHATLVVVAVFSSVLALVSGLVSLAAGDFLYDGAGPLPLDRRLLGALFVLGNMVFFAVVSLAFVLPPAALVSYFSARRIAGRLESLARGTSGLREGDLAARVVVDGADEISSLQEDFNVMAAELEKAVRDLRSERDNVERLLEAQRDLVASVSHELRTPVATMRGYLESALNGRDDSAPRLLERDLEIMHHEALRLQRLIDDLFTLSRAESGKLPLEVRSMELGPLLRRGVEAVAEGAWRMGKVDVVGTPTSPNLPPILADGDRLEQVVRNLLQNAVRHTPPGGVVALGATADAKAIVIEVKDTGEGIPPEDLERVFERFWRSESARRADQAGAGIGLTLVKGLTEAMGGEVSVESEPGAGSRFLLRMPRG